MASRSSSALLRTPTSSSKICVQVRSKSSASAGTFCTKSTPSSRWCVSPAMVSPGFGAIGEAMGGIRYTTGEVNGAPARVGVSLGDSLASLHGVIGALMSILRVKTGQGLGQVVDVSLVESVFNLMESLIPEYDLLGHVRERSGGALPGIAPSNTYRTEDGAFVVIAGNSDPIFKSLMHVI